MTQPTLAEEQTFALEHAVRGHLPVMPIDIELYYGMARAGLLEKSVELIGGLLIPATPITPQHNYAVMLLSQQLHQHLDDHAVVFTRGPIHLDNFSEPQPDVALLSPPIEQFRQRHAHADDVLLIIEVAQSSLQTDRTVKLELYARANIPEYWLVNLVDGQLETHRQPDPVRGQYRETTIHYPDEEVAPQAFPDCQLAWFS